MRQLKNLGYFRNTAFSAVSNVSDTTEFLIPNCAGTVSWRAHDHACVPEGRHDYYLLYVFRGWMSIIQGGKKERISAGDFICFYPNTRYEYQTEESDIEYFFLHFTGHGASEVLERCGIKNSKVYTAGVIDSVIEAMEKLFFDFSRQDYLFATRAASKMLKIFSVFAEKIDTSGDTAASKKIRRSIDYIYENYNKDISVPFLAELEHLSPSRYYALFKENTGYAPSEYIIILRINRACTQLLQSEASIKEVSSQVGYRDPFYFSRVFKKYMGVSPGEYKKLNGKISHLPLSN